MAKKKKVEESDEFLEALQRTFKYVIEHIKMISVIAGAVLAGVLIVLLVLYQMRLSKVKEAVLMNQAVQAYHVGNTEEALASLAKFSGKSGVNAAIAELYAGNILYDQEQFEEALGHFEKALGLSSAPELGTLRGLALQGAAYAQMALKQLDKAEEAFKGMGEQFEDLRLLELGRLYLLQGDSQEASNKLEKLTSDFPDSPWVPTAEALIE